ncbi:hypothetical protein PJ985_21280 [Streptomyces sp. ACA25]|uniref:hypothetical protein n=1 Tax=Streptomyces sp. ACA25 TaxID=3022596 RepID=UPI002307882C|nr:hypothetical protein [Streptomyces sp. ACA25]MDB1090093.1 hypothetical protein [Streptomyces sp. ACA25]
MTGISPVDRIVADSREAAVTVRARVDKEEMTGICFLRLDGEGLIASVTEYWPEPYEPSVSRAGLVERY